MKKVGLGLALLLILLSLSGCCCCCCASNERAAQVVRKINAGPVQRETLTQKRENAKQVKLTIQFAAGELKLGSDSETELMRGEFVYNVAELAPQINYDVQNQTGKLDIRHRDSKIKRFDRQVRNEWDIRLTNEIPFDLNVNVGTGTGELALGGLRLTNLNIEAGTADVQVSFEQPNPAELAVMNVRGGTARLEFIKLGNANLDKLVFDGGVGTYEFDLSGDWQRSATVQIKSGVSHIVLRLPRDIGVRLCPGDLQEGDYGDLIRQDTCYVNELYEDSKLKLDIDLDVGLSSVQVK